MSEYIVLNSAEIGFKVAELAGCSYNPAIDVSMARMNGDEFLGGVIFTGYTGESIVIHSGAVDGKWINRDMLFVTFDYPFKKLGVNRIFGHVPENNLHARTFNRKLGFKEIMKIDGVFKDNVACILMRMERDECKYLDIRPGHDPRSEYFVRAA